MNLQYTDLSSLPATHAHDTLSSTRLAWRVLGISVVVHVLLLVMSPPDSPATTVTAPGAKAALQLQLSSPRTILQPAGVDLPQPVAATPDHVADTHTPKTPTPADNAAAVTEAADASAPGETSLAVNAVPDIASDAPVAPAPGPLRLAAPLEVLCPFRAAPVYPALSRRLRESGRVQIEVSLDTAGQVVATRVITSSGSPRLDDAAVTTVTGWRCVAPTRAGTPVAAIALQQIDFELN